MKIEFPSEAAKKLAAKLHGVKIGEEYYHIPKDAKERGLVVVYGASDDLMEFEGAIDDEIGAYGGTIAYVNPSGVLQGGDYECGCKFAAQAKEAAQKTAKTIEAIWGEGDISWQYRTDIPHATFDVMEDGEVCCRGIVFDMAALQVSEGVGG